MCEAMILIMCVAATVHGTLWPWLLCAPVSMSIDLRADREGQANVSVVSSLSTYRLFVWVLGKRRDSL